MAKNNARLIEDDVFPFESLSRIAESESWRKEIHRPIYHVHKWWAKRLGSVFRGILLGCTLDQDKSLMDCFYQRHAFSNLSVLDPFMGSGTTIGEAHKLGFAALGRDINPVAVQAVKVALGPMDLDRIEQAFTDLSDGVGREIRELYRSKDSKGQPCDVLYTFWVMQADCGSCKKAVDLFSSWVIASNAYPKLKPEIKILCPGCGEIFEGRYGQERASCPSCNHAFNPQCGTTNGQLATCRRCSQSFRVLEAINGKKPVFRPYAKLVLTSASQKEYLAINDADQVAFAEASKRLQKEIKSGKIRLPDLDLEDGFNTRQAMSYGFRTWRDFFNDRQLLALGLLRNAILQIKDEPTRNVLLTLFSGVLEFNNMFASYKGEGTGAVRHMFAHHILKPERTPIEANLWGTPKSSGSFSNLFESRLLRAIAYREAPTEVSQLEGMKKQICSPPFSGVLAPTWPPKKLESRGLYLSCGDSSKTELKDESIDYVVTDPPFFDNVHYSELADFFHSWQQVDAEDVQSTRSISEVQDADEAKFALKLQGVFKECHRVLKNDGLLVFTYHHSRSEGWSSLANAVLGAGFVVVNAHPVKGEMSVAAPKAQAKEPIQFDIVIVCRKVQPKHKRISVPEALESGRLKMKRVEDEGFELSRNDRKIIIFGQLLRVAKSADDIVGMDQLVEAELASVGQQIGLHQVG